MIAIDVHFHVVPPLFIDQVRGGALRQTVTIRACDGMEGFCYHPPDGTTIEQGPALRPELSDPLMLMKALDARRLDIAAVSPPPQLFAYWTSIDEGERLARAVNDGMAELATAYPDRFAPLASIPMQDGERAAAELKRAITILGLRGVALCSHVNGRDLDHLAYRPLFAMAELLDVPVFVHPQNHGDISRIEDFHLWNLIGFPFETTITAARLIMSGLFENHPRLKVVLAHGGGFFPYQIGRLDHGHAVREELFGRLPHKPSHYLKNIYCDTLTHNPEALRYLLRIMGDDHIVLGTDYPFDMGDDRPIDRVRDLALGPAGESAIIGKTLATLLKIG
jgi:aminocarboxymuconate-semialdehyde decarboxylase